MKIEIVSTNIQRDNDVIIGVSVNFVARDTERTVSLSGYVPLTPIEYADNEDTALLEQFIRSYISEKIQKEG